MNALRLQLLAIALAVAVPSLPAQASDAPPCATPDSSIRAAVDIVCTVAATPPVGYYLMPLRRAEWSRLLTDADVGPFLSASPTVADSVVIFMPDTPDGSLSAYAVYLHGSDATALSVVAPSSQATTVHAVTSGLRPVPTSVRACACDLSYEPGQLTSDNDVPVHTYKVIAARTSSTAGGLTPACSGLASLATDARR
jgi:hypothetical protein